MSATCFALGLITILAAFAASLPVQSGSRSFSGHLKKVRPALHKAGRAFPQTSEFPQVSQDFSSCLAKI